MGALADQGRARKRLLSWFAVLGAVATGALYFVDKGAWELATLFYALASLGYFGGNIFYDSLLSQVAPPDKLDLVSGLGFAFGYLGGGLLLGINILCLENFAWLGFSQKSGAVQFAFITVALWWLVFSLPLLFKIPESRAPNAIPMGTLLLKSLVQLYDTWRSIGQYRHLVFFLVAYFFYINGVNTIIKMAVDYAMSIGLDGSQLIVALLVTQFVAFPSAIGFAMMGERWGAHRGILIAILLYILILV